PQVLVPAAHQFLHARAGRTFRHRVDQLTVDRAAFFQDGAFLLVGILTPPLIRRTHVFLAPTLSGFFLVGRLLFLAEASEQFLVRHLTFSSQVLDRTLHR